MGLWHTQFYLKSAKFKEGTCPTLNFMEIPAQDYKQKIMLKKFDDFEDYKTFIVRSVSKGASANSYRDVIYKGWKTPEKDSKLTIFSGLAIRPSRKLLDNFEVLATDYNDYAILYNCLPNLKMKKRENVLVLTRKRFEN